MMGAIRVARPSGGSRRVYRVYIVMTFNAGDYLGGLIVRVRLLSSAPSASAASTGGHLEYCCGERARPAGRGRGLRTLDAERGDSQLAVRQWVGPFYGLRAVGVEMEQGLAKKGLANRAAFAYTGS